MASKAPNPTTMVGGQRVATRRRAGGESSSGARTNLPPNSGFQKFYGFTASGIQMGQQSVLLFAILYMGAVVVLHIVSRINFGYKE